MKLAIREKLGKWMLARGRSLLMPERRNRNAITARVDALKTLWFVADAPMFIDSQQIERLFEAIFQPEYEVASRTSSREDSTAQELGLELAAGGEVSVPTIFKVSTSAKALEKSGTTNMRGESIVENAVKSPERRLEKLLNLYVYSYPERLFWVKSDLVTVSRLDGENSGWIQIEETLDQPGVRPLVVFDLARGSKLIRCLRS